MSSSHTLFAAVILIASPAFGATSITYGSDAAETPSLYLNANLPVQFSNGPDPDGNNVHTNRTGFSANATASTLGEVTKQPVSVTVANSATYQMRLVRASTAGLQDWDSIRVGLELASGGFVSQINVTNGALADNAQWVNFVSGADGYVTIKTTAGLPVPPSGALFRYTLEIRPSESTTMKVVYVDLSSVVHPPL